MQRGEKGGHVHLLRLPLEAKIAEKGLQERHLCGPLADDPRMDKLGIAGPDR